MDDLDKLLADLDTPTKKSSNKANSKANNNNKSKPSDANELDDILNDLEGLSVDNNNDNKSKGKGKAKQTEASVDELDDILASLENGSDNTKKNKAPKANDGIDSLLASLEDQNSTSTSPKPKAKSAKKNNNKANKTAAIDNALDDLDNVLAELEGKTNTNNNKVVDGFIEDLEDHGEVAAAQAKGGKKCHSCKQPIVGADVTALGVDWHEDCFSCATCKTKLSTSTFFDHQGTPFCQQHYNDKLAKKCAYCNGKINDDCIDALGRTWHPEHFFCSQCGCNFPDGKFIEHEGKAYCEEDYNNMFASNCGRCNKPILDDLIEAMGQLWHGDCFHCTTCKKEFDDAFFDFENKPYCHIHWCEKRNMICQGCMKPIEGKFVTAKKDLRFHIEHFTCAYCKKQLHNISCKERNGKYFCKPCHVKMFE